MFKPIAATAPQIPSAGLRRLDGSRASRGFSLTEILVVIVIIAVLAAILVPMFNRMREKARTAQCSGNLRQLGASINLYAAENGGSLPFIGSDDFGRGAYWFNLIEPEYLIDAKKASPSYFHCPADTRPEWKAKPGGGLNYGMNELLNRSRQAPATGVRLASVQKPASTVLLTDALNWVYVPSSDGYWGGQDMSVRRHSGGFNFLMVDGSVAWSAKRTDFFYDAAGTYRGGFPN
jgi:prepilin-type N-terminal cleavage/methylation domain-containing protein/prepilin-type processing-associated H-X9-DG protein